MDRTTGTPETTTARLLAALNGRAPRGDPELASSIEAVLVHAARADTPPADGRELDLAAIAALKSTASSAAVLGRLDLRCLAALLERSTRRLGPTGGDLAERRSAWDLLDLLRLPALLRRIEPGEREAWAGRIFDLAETSELTVGPLFRRRAELYGSKVLFELQVAGGRRTVTWRDAASRVDSLARVLLSLGDGDAPPPRVALLSENRLELALLDLACLTSGIVDVMVPANATESDVGYILRHSAAGIVVVSGREQLRKVLEHRGALAAPGRIITLDATAPRESGVETLDELRPRAEQVSRSLPQERSAAVRVRDLATVMYTSGTTGLPKGIRFSHRNIVSKRFARALALPEIGEDDVFLCYLPLCHTFGRFLEMLGCVFWGAKYCFLDDTSIEELGRGMRQYRPTVFISVPKKWIELHELITRQADPLEASEEELRRAVREVTGGRLAWGLSAAGHLDPEIFRFFGAHGVELLSGFGMTEATGGITMTAPGDYRDDSLGRALPGIELRLAEDGELLVRGPYVMEGYLDPAEGEIALDEQGWLRTGDLMEIDDEGSLRLVDRKKEIYKNLQGQTIAPQRVENFFRDFESVGRAFLVGDHREFNTLLIYPSPSYRELDLGSAPAGEVQDHFRSLIVSVNKFLAPFERIVDFAIIDRDLAAERGELTSKGTPRRKTIQHNFAEVIRGLYRRASLRVGGVELTIPNWLLQVLGLTARDIRSDGDRITRLASGSTLTVRAHGAELAQVGSCLYRHTGRGLSLGTLLASPALWLGNEELVAFASLDTTTRQRQRQGSRGPEWAGRAAAYRPTAEDRETFERSVGRADVDLLDLDLAARMLAAPEAHDAARAVDMLEAVLRREEGPLHGPARLLLERLGDAEPGPLRRRAFLALVPAVGEPRFRDLLARFLALDPTLLDAGTRKALCGLTLSEAKLEAFIDAARATPARGPLLEFLAAYGSRHPIAYRRLRAFFERRLLFAEDDETRTSATGAARALLVGFRQWLGEPSFVAVDPETGQEYRWEEVVVFEEGVPAPDRERLLSALKNTVFLKEAVFLFAKNAAVGLSDIPPGGVWIRLLGSRHGKSVYRMTVQTRYSAAYDLAVNVNHGLTPEEVREEIRWLILSGDSGDRAPLVEDFGGYWPEHDLWSEEFIEGETLNRAMRRLAREPDKSERLRRLWPFLAWATLSAYVDFWHRSGKRLEIAQADMTNIVVPTEDYVSGVRIVSLTRRRPHCGLLAMLQAFRDEFIAPAEREYPFLGGLVGDNVVFSSLLEVVGESQGLALLREALAAGGPLLPLEGFIEEVERRGFVPLRLHSAIERYRRWAELNADPTLQARALTLQELYDTYGLQRWAAGQPEIRVRFFLETVLRDSPAELSAGLWEVVRAMRERQLPADGLIDAVDALRAQHGRSGDEEYFLARLSYPYLRPDDDAGFVRSHFGGKRQSEIVVTLEDTDGSVFRVRHALNPKEVERLLQLFQGAKLDVRFRTEHRHLVALNERGQIIGGIYYEIDEENRSAHLEKIVVAERYRRKGVAHGLIHEFFNRLRAGGLATVTTGFFRPEYFYGYGFRIEKRYAGLVKSLDEGSAAEGG